MDQLPKYFNRFGEERPWPELVERFGDVVYWPAPARPGDMVWRCVALWERAPIEARQVEHLHAWAAKRLGIDGQDGRQVKAIEVAATIVVNHVDAAGNPVDGLQAAWYWPDAPADPNCGPAGGVPPQMHAGKAVHGPTNLNGDIGHAMGRGAYYWPGQGQIGPHAVWVYGSGVQSDVILGLGMLGATEHEHLDVFYQQVMVPPDVPPPEPPPEPPPSPVPWEMIEERLDAIEAQVNAIRALRPMPARRVQ